MKRLITYTILFAALVVLSFYPVVNLTAQELPAPTIFYAFDDEQTGYHTQVTDSSGNGYHGYWYNYFGGDQTMYSFYAPESGVENGAWYMSGYHECCEAMHSSSMDFILLAGTQNETNDVEGFKEEHPVFHTGMESFSVSFWFKSDRDYAGSSLPCPPDPVQMHEQEILFSFGRRNGMSIKNYKGYFSVIIGQKDTTDAAGISKEIRAAINQNKGVVVKDWQHVAATYDATTGTLAFYMDGELANSAYGDLNPVSTGFTSLNVDNSSAEIGAQNDGGLYGDVSAFWSGSAGIECIDESDDGKYRTGWPAAGYFDNFRFYKNEVLTIEQIRQQIQADTSDVVLGITPSFINNAIYPNPSSGMVTIKGLQHTTSVAIYNAMGKLVMRKDVSPNGILDINELDKGIYILKIGKNKYHKLVLQ